ncbi:MAG: fatty acid--CoA ligase family protein [Alphaproteobacteria bacterium]
MNIDFFKQSMLKNKNVTAVITDGKEYSFADIYSEYEKAADFLKKSNIPAESVVSLLADFKPQSIAMFLALIEHNAIIVPISQTIKAIDNYVRISESEYFIDISGNEPVVKPTGITVSHPMLLKLKEEKAPGLILFSSGTTGEPKAALHDLTFLLEKFKKPGKTLTTVTFLLFDHIGGFNTMMHTIANGGTIITLKTRSPDEVCSLIEKYKIELLPTSPTFINLILLNKTYEKYDLSCLKMMTYGTEPMPESTLRAMNKILPNVKLKQTYGLSEVGIMPTKSEDNTSLWMKLGGEGFETKIVDDILYIKAKSAMMGYLNAPSPFDADGWFNTKDKVEVKGDYIKILGRTTDLINVGGEKVYPIEVESALLECDGVLDVRIYGEPHPLMGKIVAAEVKIAEENNNRDFIKKLRAYCKEKLEPFKIPVKFNLTTKDLYGDRFKKKR